MQIDLICHDVAQMLGRPPEELERQGDCIRQTRHRGFLANEQWVVPQDTPLASLLDHTLLKPEATADEVRAICDEARQYGFPAVCVNPVFVSVAAEALIGSGVRVAAVVGFPLGANRSLLKAVEATDCIAQGASELDMVIPVGALKAGDVAAVLADVQMVVEAAGARALVKVILETALLTDAEIATGCVLCKWAGADYVKTSTGFGPGGATIEHVALMRQVVGPKLGVKAAGGIRTRAAALAMVAAGASRIGTSRGPQLVAPQAEA